MSLIARLLAITSGPILYGQAVSAEVRQEFRSILHRAAEPVGRKFVVTFGMGWAAYSSPVKLVEAIVGQAGKNGPKYDIPEAEQAKLLAWAKDARPGDACDGFYEATWIFCIPDDAVNSDGEWPLKYSTVDQ